ncbi:WYL domain-containing protein [Roseicella aquatilis]|uniref:WYL domain-containing protein n=1 Tax=Roseicella aquatilis TaxID=2527868 RepID=UPI0014045CA3|nr:WYL domain-containing protein [Roseicella aquatilis]
MGRMAENEAAVRLADAVHGRRAVQLLYDGAWRVVHPHALGRSGNGKLQLLAWQTAGLGRSPLPEGWRMFDLARVGGVELLQAQFAPRPQPADGRWTAGIAEPVAAV